MTASGPGAAPALAARIRRAGPIPFDEFVEAALYDVDGGFFARGRGAGRAGADFVTSPEVGSLFGACVARALDRWWDDLGRPDPFVVVEGGAGTGRLARDVRRAAPACLPALHYLLVERSAPLRDAQREHLPIEPADEALGPFVVGADDEPRPAPGRGPIFASLEDLPAVALEGAVVLANELLDNLPFGIAHWDGARWHEVRVGLDGDRFVEVLVPAPAAVAEDLVALVAATGAGAPAPGTRLPIPRGLHRWVEACGQVLGRGYLVVVDYVVPLEAVLARGGWLRTYLAHGVGGDPLDAPGSQDITADVVREQLLGAARRAGFTVVEERSQRDWLRAHGVDELVADGRRAWDEGAHRGDLAALAGRSRVREADALTDTSGLGAHAVVVLARTGPGRASRG